MIYINKKLLTGLALITMLFAPTPSYADEKIVDILPTTTSQTDDTLNHELSPTHPDLRITPDKSELIRLSAEAGSIIIGNPTHINVIADLSTTLIVVPRKIGATHFTVLDKNGQILMQRHVIVSSPKENYIRIKRSCSKDSQNCKKTSVLYCPDMCHEIISNDDTNKTTNQSETSQNDNSNGNDSVSPNAIAEETE